MIRSRGVVLLALASALVGLVGTPVGVQAQEPGAYASVDQFAYATSLIEKGGDTYMYLVGADRLIRANGRTRTTAYAKRTKCLTMERKHLKLIVCAAFVFPRKIPDKAFEFDPLLGSASLRMRNGRGRTAMSWEGRGTPEPNLWPYADTAYAGAYASVYRFARARGKIIGEPYPPRRHTFALMEQGAEAGGYTSPNMSVTRTDSGALKVEARYRIPR